MSSFDASVLHCLHNQSAFNGSMPARIGPNQDMNSSTCGFRNDLEYALVQCITCATEWNALMNCYNAKGFHDLAESYSVYFSNSYDRVESLTCSNNLMTLILFLLSCS